MISPRNVSQEFYLFECYDFFQHDLSTSDVFQIKRFPKMIFQPMSLKRDQARISVGPGMGPNRLQNLSTTTLAGTCKELKAIIIKKNHFLFSE